MAVKPGVILACLLAFIWAGSSWADLAPYQARYSIYRNGKLTGKLEIELKRDGKHWEIHSEGSGTHGLAELLGARDSEKVSGLLSEGRYLPLSYTRHTQAAGIDEHYETTFDWQADQVTIVHDGNASHTLPLRGSALDPLTMKLEIRRRLSDPDPHLSFLMVEEEQIDTQNFKLLEAEWLETSLGCMETTPIEKIRQNSRRYTRAWHAPAYGNIEVRIEHGKTGGDHMEMRITELSFGGVLILPRPGCSAMQSARKPEPVE
ncbi:MAG: DUF3108 domain-containing protein [Xanthomonadales bacterium]|nr:DUF3108 domain-containing protein [Xanthomonadales bacterium]